MIKLCQILKIIEKFEKFKKILRNSDNNLYSNQVNSCIIVYCPYCCV